MKDKYKVSDLITGNVSSTGEIISNETFIFERQKERILSSNKRRKYQEIFTELGINSYSDNPKENFYFSNSDQNYIVNIESIAHSGLLMEEEKTSGIITKIRLLELYNHLNFSRDMIIPRGTIPKQKVRKRKRG